MQFDIDKGKSIPPIKHRDGKFAPTLRQLQIGDSFLIPTNQFTNQMTTDIHTIAKRCGIRVAVRAEEGGLRVWRIEKTTKITLPPPIKDQTHWGVREGHNLDMKPIVLSVEQWIFTKDKPQFADDGQVYRKQYLASNPKQTRTVRVSGDDTDIVLD